MTEHIRELVERSSLGTPAAKAARASVPDAVVRHVVEAAKHRGNVWADIARVVHKHARTTDWSCYCGWTNAPAHESAAAHARHVAGEVMGVVPPLRYGESV